MATNDVYQLTDVQSLEGQQVLNVYYYRQNSTVVGSGPAEALADAYIGQVLPDVLSLQTASVVHTSIRVENLFNSEDVFEELISEAGTWVGAADTESSFSAAGFRLVGDNGEVRTGAKRYAGMGEEVDTNGIYTDADFIAALVTLGVALIAGLDVGIVQTFFPVIVKRILEAGQYRLPESLGELVYASIADALYNIAQTSQVSRKIGRGS